MAFDFSQKIKNLPESPGVYLMKDQQGTIFYIGKAKNLKDRVRSYFNGADTRAFVALLDHLLVDIDVVLTDSEKEALLVENDLIKAHKPRFNVRLIDDKNFLCLRLNLKHPYPRLDIVRQLKKDGARYFGPYHDTASLRTIVRLINRYFQLRTCSDSVLKSRTRPCLQYQIKRCPAPCVFDLSGGAYAQHVQHVIDFLDGKTSVLLESLQRDMQQHAQTMAFELAAVVRDQINAIKRSLEPQRMVQRDFVNRDVIGFYRQGPVVEIHVMRTRAGRIIDAERFSLYDTEVPSSDILADFSGRYYDDHEAPDEILFGNDMEWAQPLSIWLSERYKRNVIAMTPKRGDKQKLVALAYRNAEQAFVDKQRYMGAAKTIAEKLQRSLHLKKLPVHVECFDISHLQGTHIVASCVHFEHGMAQKNLYKHYHIKSTTTQDDFKSMYEVVSRRAAQGLEDGDLPDLIVIDGGKGQLASARAALDDHGIDDIDLIALAKSRVQDDTRSDERVFVHNQKNPIVLRQNSAELFLLTRARDEAHRFAITFHRVLRKRAATRSALDDIPGIGSKRRQTLLRAFGSIKQLKNATEQEIAAVVGPKLATIIKKQLL